MNSQGSFEHDEFEEDDEDEMEGMTEVDGEEREEDDFGLGEDEDAEDDRSF